LDAEIVELGRGLDNAVYAAGELVLRIGDGRRVGREARLLEAVASYVSIPIPKPRFVDEDAGVLSYELLPGQPLLGSHGSSFSRAAPRSRTSPTAEPRGAANTWRTPSAASLDSSHRTP
jgi:hypothetical protein